MWSQRVHFVTIKLFTLCVTEVTHNSMVEVPHIGCVEFPQKLCHNWKAVFTWSQKHVGSCLFWLETNCKATIFLTQQNKLTRRWVCAVIFPQNVESLECLTTNSWRLFCCVGFCVSWHLGSVKILSLWKWRTCNHIWNGFIFSPVVVSVEQTSCAYRRRYCGRPTHPRHRHKNTWAAAVFCLMVWVKWPRGLCSDSPLNCLLSSAACKTCDCFCCLFSLINVGFIKQVKLIKKESQKMQHSWRNKRIRSFQCAIDRASHQICTVRFKLQKRVCLVFCRFRLERLRLV